MALTDSFMATCRAAVLTLSELTTFQTALTNAQAATRANRIAAWHAAYSDTISGPSPANNLRRAIRDTVNAQADINGTLGLLDRESAYRTLVAEVVPNFAKPLSDAQEAAALETILREEQLS